MGHGRTNMIKGYKLWLGYGEHKWFGKWGDGKDWRWYLYRLWLWIGGKSGYIKKYNSDRQIALDNARQALEDAFTPQLRKMLDDKVV
jgi:hypothetical protein